MSLPLSPTTSLSFPRLSLYLVLVNSPSSPLIINFILRQFLLSTCCVLACYLCLVFLICFLFQSFFCEVVTSPHVPFRLPNSELSGFGPEETGGHRDLLRLACEVWEDPNCGVERLPKFHSLVPTRQQLLHLSLPCLLFSPVNNVPNLCWTRLDVICLGSQVLS